MISVLVGDTQERFDRQKRRRQCDQRGRAWNDMVTQGHRSRISDRHQKLKEQEKKIHSGDLESPEGVQPL